MGVGDTQEYYEAFIDVWCSYESVEICWNKTPRCRLLNTDVENGVHLRDEYYKSPKATG